METPMLSPGTLILRFVLELAALGAWGWVGWTAGEAWGAVPWLPAFALPLTAVVVWGTFNVPGDPSRSGRAPVPVAGWVRLGVEAVFFVGAWAGLAAVGAPVWAAVLGGVTVVQYATSVKRLAWMVRR
jgi:hypothetical protein